ncbi:MAG: hypothetical protein HC769_08735 [Cyanobacteria bacterium CRU_2_1]|nr:hypothetical protein [Cyanobacteria bacterium RU_5_0]NJR58923.1 hypothetical protein [Cyanobacteria bacterium CRU_2_1]
METHVPTLKTVQDLEQAIQRYRKSDWSSNTVFALWEAIRNAALAQTPVEQGDDRVPGEDSY